MEHKIKSFITAFAFFIFCMFVFTCVADEVAHVDVSSNGQAVIIEKTPEQIEYDKRLAAERDFEIRKWAALLAVLHCQGRNFYECSEAEVVDNYISHLKSVDKR